MHGLRRTRRALDRGRRVSQRRAWGSPRTRRDRHASRFGVAATPAINAGIHPGSLRFLSRDRRGTGALRRGLAETPASARQHAPGARAGRGRLAQLAKTHHDKASVADLNWLAGEWNSIPRQTADPDYLGGFNFLRHSSFRLSTSGISVRQCRKCRRPVKTIAMSNSLHASITS